MDMLNLLFGVSDASDQFWKEDMRPMLLSKFERSLLEEEKDDNFNLKVTPDHSLRYPL